MQGRGTVKRICENYSNTHQVEKVAEAQLVSGHLDPCSDQASVNLLFVDHLELVAWCCYWEDTRDDARGG